jgi:hypothetical protein
MSGVAAETMMAAGYALFLALGAVGLDLLARSSHRRAQTYRTAGFSYDEGRDAWVCPEGEQLHRVEVDPHLRLVRYRARAHICNSCRLKEACTDSDHGREVTRAIDPWPHSEAGRFHRVIALVMVGLTALVLAAAATLNHTAADLVVLAAALGASALATVLLLADLRQTPSGYPWPEGQSSGDAPTATPLSAQRP